MGLMVGMISGRPKADPLHDLVGWAMARSCPCRSSHDCDLVSARRVLGTPGCEESRRHESRTLCETYRRVETAKVPEGHTPTLARADAIDCCEKQLCADPGPAEPLRDVHTAQNEVTLLLTQSNCADHPTIVPCHQHDIGLPDAAVVADDPVELGDFTMGCGPDFLNLAHFPLPNWKRVGLDSSDGFRG